MDGINDDKVLKNALNDAVTEYEKAVDELWIACYKLIRVAALNGITIGRVELLPGATIESGELTVNDKWLENMYDLNVFDYTDTLKRKIEDLT